MNPESTSSTTVVTEPAKSRKKPLLISAVSIVVVLLAVGYFFLIPSMQVKSYKSVVKEKQPHLRDNVNKVSDFLKSQTFVNPDTEPTEATAEFSKTRENIKDLEQTLTNDKKALTGFNALPLLSWNSKYKAAKEIKSNEEKYIASTENYVKELKATLDFMEKDNNLSQSAITVMDEVDLASQKSTTLQEYGTTIEPSINKLVDSFKQYSALKPTADYKEVFDANVQASNAIITILQQIVSAAKANNEAKVTDLSIQMQTKILEEGAKTDELAKKFVSESTLSKTDTRLRDLARAIDTSIAKL